MTRIRTITFAAAILLLSVMAASAVNSTEVRSTVAEVIDGATYQWDASNFAGFYYDIDDNLGKEQIQMAITNDNELSGDYPYGVVYTTQGEPNDFEFEKWGQFFTIGFLSENYFAGYVDEGRADMEQYLFYKSDDEVLLNDEQLSKVLYDDDTERTVTTGSPLKLMEGYELAIRTIDLDANKVYVQLMKDGNIVNSAVVSPSKDRATMADETYTYKKDLGDTKKIVVIAVHFKNAFRGAGEDLATVNGIWQISDMVTDVEANTEYDKMTIETVDAASMMIEMNNQDSKISLSKNKDTSLMGDIRIKTADSDDIPNRFYIYKEMTEPGTYETRGQVKTVQNTYWLEYSDDSPVWTAENFAGFYYDIDNDLGKEQIQMTITNGNELSGDYPYGVVYNTEAQINDFKFQAFGNFYAMAFMGQLYFAGYIDDMTSGEILNEATTSNLLGSGLLSDILVDDSTSMVVASGETVDLSEGYALRPQIGIDDKGILVELLHDSVVIDQMAILPPVTYVYSADQGDAQGVPIIAAHFLEPVSLDDRSYCKIDGLWQISDSPVLIEEDAIYDKMTVQSVDPESMRIVMNNEDNKITLNKNKDISLMGDIRIKTADQDVIYAEEPLRFYVYKTVTVSGSEELI